MKATWIVAAALACTPAFGQLGNFLKNLDTNKILDTGKKVVEATREFGEPEEIALGEGITAGFLGAAPLHKDANLQRYVNRVGRWLALHSDRPDLPWSFGVIAGDSVNAFAMPGGTVIVSEGLLKRLGSEAELAGALSHEIAHVVMKHQLSAIQSSMRTNIAKSLASDAAGDAISRRGGNALTQQGKAALAEVGLEAVKNGLFLRPLDRGMEYDADRMAIVIAARSGYDPYGLVGVLQMLAAVKGDGSGASIFDTHPAAEDRLSELERQQRTLDRYAAQPQNEQRYRQVVGAAK